MAALTLVCTCCDARLFIMAPRKGRSAGVHFAKMAGWHFDTENSWRCPAHPAPEQNKNGA